MLIIYLELQARSEFSWQCPPYLLSMLPFGGEPDLNSSVCEICTQSNAGLPIVSDMLSILPPGVGVIHHNVQGLVSKIVDVEQWVGDCVNTASVFCFSETWINPESPPVFTFPGFQGYYSPPILRRSSTSSGFLPGSCMFVSNTLIS